MIRWIKCQNFVFISERARRLWEEREQQIEITKKCQEKQQQV